MSRIHNLRKMLASLKENTQSCQTPKFEAIKNQIFGKSSFSTCSSDGNNHIFPIVTLSDTSRNRYYSVNTATQRNFTEQTSLIHIKESDKSIFSRTEKKKSFCLEPTKQGKKIFNEIFKSYSLTKRDESIRKPQILMRRQKAIERLKAQWPISNGSVMIMVIKKPQKFTLKLKENVKRCTRISTQNIDQQNKQNFKFNFVNRNMQRVRRCSPDRKFSISPWNNSDDEL